MKCPRCDVDLVKGFAIAGFNEPPARGITFFPYVVDHKTLRLEDCLKCPKCGYSDDGQ